MAKVSESAPSALRLSAQIELGLEQEDLATDTLDVLTETLEPQHVLKVRSAPC
jgi:hypothetical protein